MEPYNGPNKFCQECITRNCHNRGNTSHCPGKFVCRKTIVDGEKHVVEFECYPL